MRRAATHIALLCTAAFMMTGCASLGLSFGDSAPAPAKTAAVKDDSSATNPYDSLIGKQPHNLDGQIRKAQLLRAGGDFPGAVHILAQLMLVAPDDPRIVGEYGKVLTQEGRSNDALAFLNRAIELQPDNWTFYSATGVAYDQLDARDKAEAAYKHALLLKPGEPSVLNNYAMSQMMAGHLNHAQALLHEAAVHGGDYPRIAANLKMIVAMTGTPEPQPGSVPKPMKSITPAPDMDVASMTKVPALKAANKAPEKIASKLHSTAANRLPPPLKHKAKAKPEPRVVMEKVPFDPLAGKIYGHHSGKTPVHVAVAKAMKRPAGPQQVAEIEGARHSKPASDRHHIPALRTSADLY